MIRHKDKGVIVNKIEPGTKLEIKTKNSFYEMIKKDYGDSFFIKGGKYLPNYESCRIYGSNYGGKAIRIDFIGINMYMEIETKQRKLITSRVKEVTVIGTDWHYILN